MKNPAHPTSILSAGLQAAFLALSLAILPLLANAQSAPSFSAHPSPVTVSLPTSATASFSVVVSGDPVPTIQWQVDTKTGAGWVALTNDSVYSGVTSTTLVLTGVTTALNSYDYRAVATNSVSSVNSNGATLTVQSAPAFTTAATTNFTYQEAGSFVITATGFPTPTITLQPGAPVWLSLQQTSSTTNSRTVTMVGTPSTNAGSTVSFAVRASNVAGNTDQDFSLVVRTVPAVSSQPTDASGALGQSATFSAVVSGFPAPSLQWQRQAAGSAVWADVSNDGTFSGVTSSSLSIARLTSGLNGDSFRVVATNSAGSVNSNSALLTITNSTVITTFAGKASEAGATDGLGGVARFNGPSGIALDSAGNIYVADTSNHVIRKVSAAGSVSTLAGVAGSSGSSDGAALAARFSGPSAVAVAPSGTVYVADTYNHVIRAIAPDGTTTTLAGVAGATGGTDGSASTARFYYPSGIAYSPGGFLVVADTFNHTIRRVQLSGTVSTIAGVAGSSGSANGNGAAARFSQPYSVAVDSSGVIYVADSGNHVIRKIIDVETFRTVSTPAGSAGVVGGSDGTGSAASFNQPSAVACDSSGNVFVADTSNNTVRRMTPAGVVTTVAGSAGLVGSADGVIGAARFRRPLGVAVNSSGTLYVADTSNHTLRSSGSGTAPSITTQPQPALSTDGGSATFSVVANGTPVPTYFTWMRQPRAPQDSLSLPPIVLTAVWIRRG